jgi:hypothetical protein
MPARVEQTEQQKAFAITSILGSQQETHMLVADNPVPVRMVGYELEPVADYLTTPFYRVPVRTSAQFNAFPDEMRFQYLAARWLHESSIMSSTTEIVMLPSYQSIMAMGPIAVPFILRQLQSEGDQPNNWFWALRHITLANPVPSELRGNRRAMARAWLEWARPRYAW